MNRFGGNFLLALFATMKVLLSIKLQYAEAILSGRKRYEYRRAIFKRPGSARGRGEVEAAQGAVVPQ